MDKVRKILGIIVIMALLLSSSVPFVTQLATAAEGEGGMATKAEPMEEVVLEEDTSGELGGLSVKPAHMVLEDVVEISRAEPVRETVPLSPGWENIMTDGFEEGFPGTTWTLYGTPTWEEESYNPYSGSNSVWCAGSSYDPPSDYTHNMDAWMVYGPFSLADATDAKVDFWLWLDSESDFDFVSCMASTNETDFYGTSWSGSTDWLSMSFDLTNVYTLGNLCGEPEVWIAFTFDSDDSFTYQGAFIDDVVLQKYVPSAQFDLEAVEVYLSTQTEDVDKNYVVDTPTVGQEVYFHFKWNCLGSETTPSFHLDLNLDAVPFCGGDRTAEGGYAYTTWCTDPWTATAGSHTLTGVLDVYDDVSESNEANNEANKNWNTGGGEAVWTFMVYLDGDNDLEESEIGSFNYMELAANNAYVNIVVQFDRTPGYDTSNGDWTTTRRYKVKYDTDMVNFASYTEGVDYWDLGELNMADPNTLIGFVQWAKSNYPADHYCLALSNHGSGWKPMAGGQLVPKGILWDDTDGDYMSTAELGNALNSATSGGTEKLDVLFLDACLMQMVEVGYEIKDYAQYLVTSEYILWGPEPYDDYISSITSTTTASQLATTVVNEYHNYLTGMIYAHTMSAVELSQLGLASVVDDFAQALTTGLPTYRTKIENSRSACQKFYDDSYIDLYHFAFLIDQNIADATIQNAAQAVMTAVNNAVIAEAHENGSGGEYYPLDNANGISIYFPASEGDSGYSNYNSGNLAFVADKGWDEFLAALFGEALPTVTSVAPDSGNQGQTLDVSITGTNLSGATAVSFGAGITINSFSVVFSTLITANITVAAGAALGPRDVSVTTPAGTGALAGGFTVTAPAGLPTVTSVAPDSGNQGQTLDVSITGTNLSGATAVSFGAGITINSFSVVFSTLITANITVAAGAALGPRDVSVTTPAGTGVLVGGFTVGAEQVETWNCPLGGVVLIAPYPIRGRPFLTIAVDPAQITVSAGAALWGIYYLDETTGEWLYFIPGFTSTLTVLEPDEFYLVVVSGACTLTIPQGT